MPRYNGSNTKVPLIEKLIHEYLGVAAAFDPNYDRLKIVADNRVQSRIDRNNAPVAMVNRYANQMGEFEFPPIILTEDGIKVDGNTRDKAHAKRGDRYVPALVIPLKWEGANKDVKQKLLLLSETLNNMNGLPLGQEEHKTMAYTMIELGMTDTEIVGKTGLNLSIVRDLRQKYQGRERLRSLGINPDQGSVAGVVRAFGKPIPQELDDDAFLKLAELTNDAGLKSQEVGALATALAQQGSKELRDERVARERKARADQITALGTGQTIPKLAASLRKRLAILLEHPLNAFVERDPELVAEHVALLEKAEEVLRNIRTAHVAAPSNGKAAQTGTRQ